MRITRNLGGTAALTAAIVTGVGAVGFLSTAAPARQAPVKKPTAGLARFSNCADLRRYATRHSLSILSTTGIGPYPVSWVGGGPMFRDAVPVPASAAPETSAAPTAGANKGGDPGTQGVDYSGTNLQEADVDEPDLVLSDAKNIMTVTGDGKFRIFEAGDTPALVGSLKLDDASGAQLLRAGDRVLVISTQWGPVDTAGKVAPGGPAIDVMVYSQPRTVVHLVDISDTSNPRLVETLAVDGTLIGARRPANGAVRLVVQSRPDPIPMYGVGAPNVTTEAQAKELNRRAISRAKASTWLPSMKVSGPGKKAVRRSAVACHDVARATEFAGLNEMVVLTIDPAKGVTPVDRDAVMTDGDIVYGSARSLYVSTPWWVDQNYDGRPPRDARTQIHRFDISLPAATGYASSGEVPGHILNQFSMSEKDGVLRVASTLQPSWFGDQTTKSESFVTTLREQDRSLVRVGRVSGLGKDERIYGVRFLGNMGYVVTFRQMDPLYVVDLTNPAAPVKRGELKIPGYSAYLHPVGDGLILGVGQNATDEGRPLGTQISLFDVSNPDNPTRIQNVTMPEGWSDAEGDHHAFLYWAPTGLAMIPVNTYSNGTSSSEAVGVFVSRSGITRVRSVSHPRSADYPPQINRSMVIGNRVFTLSNEGLQALRLDNLAPLGYTKFG